MGLACSIYVLWHMDGVDLTSSVHLFHFYHHLVSCGYYMSFWTKAFFVVVLDGNALIALRSCLRMCHTVNIPHVSFERTVFSQLLCLTDKNVCFYFSMIEQMVNNITPGQQICCLYYCTDILKYFWISHECSLASNQFQISCVSVFSWVPFSAY